MNFRNPVLNVIVNLDPDEIAQIISDIKLISSGYTFFFAIDTYDIIANYLPYTEANVFDAGNKNQLAQKAIAYDSLFNSNKEKNLILLEEYKMELLSVKYHIEKQIRSLYSLRSNLAFLKEEVAALENEGAPDQDFRNNFELILTLLILFERKMNIKDDLFEFLTKRVSMFIEETGDPYADAIARGLAEQESVSGFGDLVFDEFIQKMALQLLTIDSDIKRYQYLENTYRDIMAIQRVIHLNRRMESRQGKEKIAVLYLSSAPVKSKQLFSIIESLSDGKEGLPMVGGIEKFNFHRNIFQLFLLHILGEEFGNNPSPQIKFLDSLKKLSLQMKLRQDSQRTTTRLDEESELVYKNLNTLLDRYSSKIDNHFYFRIFEKFMHAHKSESIGRRAKYDKEVLSILKKAETFVHSEKSQLEDLDFLSFNIYSYRQAFTISSLLDPNSKITYTVYIQFGKDIIQQQYQHLPLLLLMNEPMSDEMTGNLYAILHKVADTTMPDDTHTDAYLPLFKTLFSLIAGESQNLDYLSKEAVLIAYFNMMTLPREVLSTDKQEVDELIMRSEKEIISLLKKQKKLIGASAIGYKVDTMIDGVQLLRIEKRNVRLLREIDYILLWLLRRNCLFDEGIALAGPYAQKPEPDPRFLQGLALCYISKAYNLNKLGIHQPGGEGVDHLYAKAIDLLESAGQKYEELSTQPLHPSIALMIGKNQLAINNSLCDLLIRKHMQRKDQTEQYMVPARKFLQQLKILLAGLSLHIEDFPIFALTEAELEFAEAKTFFESGAIGEANTKILHATDRIFQCRKRHSTIHPVFNTVFEEIEKLRIEIFKRRGIIK